MKIRAHRLRLRCLGIEIERKTDILAAAAFIISIAGVLYQVFAFFEPVKVVQFPPEQLLFLRQGGVLHMAAQVTYVNQSKEGKNAVARTQTLTFELGGKKYVLRAQSFEKFTGNGKQLIREYRESARSLVIKAGEAISEEIVFAPRRPSITEARQGADPNQNLLPWDQFVSDLSRVKEFDVEIVSELYGLENIATSVFVPINSGLISALTDKEKTPDQWSAPSCWPR